MVGGSIGLTFALSLVIASPLLHSIGMSGIFSLMAVFGVVAIGVFVVLRLVAMLTMEARSDRFPGTTRVVLSFASLPN